MLTAENVKRIAREVAEYEKKNFGIRFGADFNEFANVFESSADVTRTSLEILVLTMLTSKPPEPTPESLVEFARESPAFNRLIEFAYLGYRIGRASLEIEELERIRNLSRGGNE